MKIIKTFLSILYGIIVGLVLAECIFYLFPSLNQKYSLEKFVSSSPRLDRQLNVKPYLYRPSDILGYERIPNSAPEINSFGLIGDEIDIDKKEDVFRILVLGDSLIEQNYFVEYLREWLNNLDTRTNVEIINAGVGAYEAWHYARYLKYKGVKLNPDMVIISLCLNDFNHPYEVYYKTIDGFMEFCVPMRDVKNRISINLFLFKRSYLYRLFILSLHKLSQNDTTVEDIIFDEGIYHMRAIKEICQDNKIALFCFIWPYFMPDSSYADWQKKEHQNMVKVLNVLNIDYIDLHQYFSDEIRRSLKKDERDFIHPTQRGHKIAADIIFKHLVSEYGDYFSYAQSY